MTLQNTFLLVPFSRKRNMAVRIGGKRYFSASSTMLLPFFHSFSIFLEFCLTM